MKAALFLLVALIGLSAASLPSDEIRHIAPPATIDLQHVDPAVAKLYGAQDGNLGPFRGWELPNIGHYASWATTAIQSDTVLSDSQQDILTEVPSNDTGINATQINSTSGGLIYL